MLARGPCFSFTPVRRHERNEIRTVQARTRPIPLIPPSLSARAETAIHEPKTIVWASPSKRAVRARLLRLQSTSPISSKAQPQQLPLRCHTSVSSRCSPPQSSPHFFSKFPSAQPLELPSRSNAPGHPRGGGRRRASAFVGEGIAPSTPRAWLGRDSVALQQPGGAELRRGDRGRRARGARRGDPAQAALPRRRRRPLRLRPREGLRSRYAGPHASPSYFGSSGGALPSSDLGNFLVAPQVLMCCRGTCSSPGRWTSSFPSGGKRMCAFLLSEQ